MAIQIHSEPCQRKCLLTENRHRDLILLLLRVCGFYDAVENISYGNVCCRMNMLGLSFDTLSAV